MVLQWCEVCADDFGWPANLSRRRLASPDASIYRHPAEYCDDSIVNGSTGCGSSGTEKEPYGSLLRVVRFQGARGYVLEADKDVTFGFRAFLSSGSSQMASAQSEEVFRWLVRHGGLLRPSRLVAWPRVLAHGLNLESPRGGKCWAWIQGSRPRCIADPVSAEVMGTQWRERGASTIDRGAE